MSEKSRTALLEEATRPHKGPATKEKSAQGHRQVDADAQHRLEQLETELGETANRLAKMERLNRTLVRQHQRSGQLLKRLEDTVALVEDHAADLLLRLDKGGKVRSAASASAQLLGYEPTGLEGRSFYELLPREDRTWLKGLFKEALRSSKVEHVIVRLRHRDQEMREFDCFCRAVPHIRKQMPELMCLLRAIGAGPAAADEMEPTSAAEFAGRLAHELSQPLTAIGSTTRVCARLLREELGPDHEVTQALEQTVAQSERAAEMIKRLRHLSTGAPPARSSVQVNDSIREAVKTLEPQLRHVCVDVKLTLAEDLPEVPVDPIQIGQVLVNLVRNAVEAMAENTAGPRQLNVHTKLVDGEVEIGVADTGPGLSVAMIEKLFEPYQTTKPLGMGLGLALCRSIIQAHRGRIWLRPNQPRGAIFTFVIPLEP